MTSATLTAWLKQPGERVVQGEPIVEVDTDGEGRARLSGHPAAIGAPA